MGRAAPRLEPTDHTGAGKTTQTTEKPRPSKRSNVLLIGVETLRADHVGCLGYDRDTTPTLDRLAREGTVCTRNMSTSGWTLPSVMSVMTSLYPTVHRAQTYRDKLSGGITTLAEVMKAEGYTTVGVVGNPTIEGKYGFSDGFDLYDDFTVSLDLDMDIFRKHNEIGGDRHLTNNNELVTKVAVKWLEAGPAEPFLLFVFYFDPHYDYIPPAPFDTMFDPDYEGHMDGRGMKKEPRHSQRPPDRDLQHLLALYDGEIRYTDGHVGQLLQALAKSGVLKNTLIVLFGDHGDEFYEHGKTTHARTLYNEIVHVPLILRWPGRLPAGRRIDAITSLVDIMPTILDFLDLPYEGPMQGISLRPLIEGTAGESRHTVWAELNMENHIQAILGDDHRLLRDMRNSTWELYHLPSDPGEQTNLYEQPSAKGVRLALRAEWERWARDNGALVDRLAQGGETEKIQLDEQQLQKLKALGYVQ
jgi:arylsulfatase A-like enzyme